MREIGNMANGTVIRGPLGPALRAFRLGRIRIPLAAVAANRKSGIRIHPKSPEIRRIQISNRKYSLLLRSPWRIAIFNRAFDHSPRFLIYGSAIKTPRKALKT